MPAPDVFPAQVRARLEGDDPPFLLDVREPAEVAEWAFPGAVNIPLGELGDRLDEVPRDREVVVVCRSGARSAAAANALVDAGWQAENLAGGAMAWQASELG